MELPPAAPDPLSLLAARALWDAGAAAPGGRIVAAVSGGPDSVALLLLLHDAVRSHALPLRLAAAHFHHGLRGPRADEDLEFVRSLAASLGLPFLEGRGEVAARARRERRGIEAAARKARYEFLLGAARAFEARAVATGHTRDDQAETVLLRIRRGCGLEGLSGIHPVRPLDPEGRILLVRPLLGVPRDGILAFLSSRAAAWRLDETNLDTRFDRNRLRLETLPELRRLLPGADEALARVASAAWALRPNGAGPAGDETPGPSRVRIRRGENPVPPFTSGRLFQAAHRRAGGPPGRLDRRHIEALERMLAGLGPKAIALPGSVTARREFEGLSLEPTARPLRALPIPETPLPAPGRAAAGRFALSADLEEDRPGNGIPLPRSALRVPHLERVDASAVAFPLTVRSRKPGDRFHPLGGPGRRRLKEFLRAEGVPEAFRDAVPLVLDASGRILWVAGIRIAHWARITPETRRVLRLALHPGAGEGGT